MGRLERRYFTCGLGLRGRIEASMSSDVALALASILAGSPIRRGSDLFDVIQVMRYDMSQALVDAHRDALTHIDDDDRDDDERDDDPTYDEPVYTPVLPSWFKNLCDPDAPQPSIQDFANAFVDALIHSLGRDDVIARMAHMREIIDNALERQAPETRKTYSRPRQARSPDDGDRHRSSPLPNLD